MLKVLPDNTIKLTRGDTAALTVPILNEVTGEAYTMGSTDTLTLSVKKSVKDTEYSFQKVSVGANRFVIEPMDTKGLKFGKYVYDVQLDTSSGGVSTIIEPATFEILSEVT